MTAVVAQAPNATALLGPEPQQVQAALLLATGMSLTKVAKEVGCDRRTLFVWRQQPEFTAVLEMELAIQAQLVREATHTRLLGMAELALDVVEAALKKGGSRALSAARIVLSRADAPDLGALPTGAEMVANAEQQQIKRLPQEQLEALLQQHRDAGLVSSPLYREWIKRLDRSELSEHLRRNLRGRKQEGR